LPCNQQSRLSALKLSKFKDNLASSIGTLEIAHTVKQGLITSLIAVARQAGESAYVNEGLNCWPAAHVTDVARLYRLALEKREASRYHAVAEEGIPLRDIAAAIGRGLKVPVTSISSEEAQARFGRIGGYVGMDLSASSDGRGSGSVGRRPDRHLWKISTVCAISKARILNARLSLHLLNFRAESLDR